MDFRSHREALSFFKWEASGPPGASPYSTRFYFDNVTIQVSLRYNQHRPHRALDGHTPETVYRDNLATRLPAT